MATTAELAEQFTKVRQEISKLMEILAALEPVPPPVKKTRART